jgi:proline iminopeptidase
MDQERSKKEGYAKVKGGRIWYKVVGEKSERAPAIVIHGGPGYPHDYLEPLMDLSEERQIIFYDQLGCGNSERNDDRSLWTVSRFVEELRSLTKELKLNKYHIIAHSWGPAIAVSYALKKPSGLRSLVLTSPFLSAPRWQQDADRLIGQLPRQMQKAIYDYERKKSNIEEYHTASREFFRRFINRMDPLPEPFNRARMKMNFEMYNYMWGLSEYKVNGTLKKFDISKKLHQVRVPVLLISGRYDEATPESLQYFKRMFPAAQTRIFENSAHFPFWNERDAYMDAVSRFMRSTEKQRKG